MSKIIDGKAIAAQVRAEIKSETEYFTAKTGIVPGLATILVGANPASQVYVRNKHKACAEVGFTSFNFEFPETITEAELIDTIQGLNKDSAIHGILVQLPLPRHINQHAIIEAIDPKKDVDGFHPYNMGRLMIGQPEFVPCTPLGVMELLRRSGVSIRGRNCVVIGRSNIVGKPLAQLLLQADGTVTVCHSKTPDLRTVCREADILVAAIGQPNFIDSLYVKEGAIVIDVGINRLDNGTLCGDVNFQEVAPIADAITPVPGGVGPMTIAMLLYNTLQAAKNAA